MLDFKAIIDDALRQRLDVSVIGDSIVSDAMRYAVYNGGKRVRPQLLLRMLYDLTGDYKKGLDAACALEMIHTYSLIHDDLPAMDNDDYRRGQYTVHKKYGEDIGVLAGDGLLTQAFVCLSKTDLPSDIIVDLIYELSDSAGVTGMIYGQELDLKSEGQKIELEKLQQIHRHKTGKLLKAPVVMASLIAEKKDMVEKMTLLGEKIGLAFQIQDDVFDQTKHLKNPDATESSDSKNDKVTYLSFYSVEQATQIAEILYKEVYEELMELNCDNHSVIELIEGLSFRAY